MRDIGQSVVLLRSDVRGGWDGVSRVDEEECQYFAMTRFLWIDKLERLYLVLVEVGKRDAAIGFRDHIPDFLDIWEGPEETSLERVFGLWIGLKVTNFFILYKITVQSLSYSEWLKGSVVALLNVILDSVIFSES